MTWTLTNHVGEYADRVRGLLEQDPAQNTVGLTVLSSLERGQKFSDVEPTLGWYSTNGEVVGAVCLTPPYELQLLSVPEAAIGSLVEALRTAAVDVPGVNGRPELVEDFAARWFPDADRSGWLRHAERLYELEVLVAPEPLPAGLARPATQAEFARLVGWFADFHAEATHHSGTGHEELVRFRIDSGLAWVWERDGEPVSMAARNATASGVARVGPVYTPPAHRRQGYGAAVTAACTADALATDARDVVLFTDLANPTSNAIYQSIGFRPRADRLVYRFDGGN